MTPFWYLQRVAPVAWAILHVCRFAQPACVKHRRSGQKDRAQFLCPPGDCQCGVQAAKLLGYDLRSELDAIILPNRPGSLLPLNFPAGYRLATTILRATAPKSLSLERGSRAPKKHKPATKSRYPHGPRGTGPIFHRSAGAA